MWRRLANLMQRFDTLRYRREIERALALHLRGEVRSDGLKVKTISNRLEIEWWARDIHPWDRHDPPNRRASLFVRQSLADTEAALTRLFQALPQVDAIALTVLEPDSESVIMTGTVDRSAVEPDARLSDGMRLWQRGITYHSDGSRFEHLDSGDDLALERVSKGPCEALNAWRVLRPADQSGHFIQLDQPELVIQAIRDVFLNGKFCNGSHCYPLLPRSFRPESHQYNG